MVAPVQKSPQKEFRKIPLPSDLMRDIPLSENALTVLRKRYLRRGEDGKPVENEQEMFWRVAYHVALAEKDLGGSDEQVEFWARKYYDLLTTLRFFPNSPTFTGAGTPLGQLAACFVLAIEDDMGRTGSGIFETLRHAALIQQTGGGNGFSFSRLRPRGAVVKSSNGAATGPVGFLRVYDQAFGEIAQGGCLTPETLVFTERGLLRLDEIVTHDEYGWCPHELYVPTDEGMRPSYQGYNNGVVPVLRVVTDDGIELVGTPNHKVKVMSSEGAVWRRFDELQAGDALLVALGQHQGHLQSLIAPKRRHGNQIMPAFPTVLDENFAFFLGYLIGDGFITSTKDDHRIGVTVAHSSYLVNEMPKLMHQLFGEHLTVHVQQKAQDASVTYTIDNRALKDFFALNGLDKPCSTEACVPRLIRQSPPEVVGAFLRGLFEADGTDTHGYPHLVSSSEQLIREVAILLIGLGCPVRIYRNPESQDRYGTIPTWSVKIQSFRGLQAWKTAVGCDPRSRFDACMVYEPDLSRECNYPLPHSDYWLKPVLDAITLPQIDKRGRGMSKNLRASQPELRRSLLRHIRGDRQLTLSGYTLLHEQYDEFAEHAPPVENFWFATVNRVEAAGEAPTLDLEVEGNHTYLANGVVSHNSRRGANMAVLRVDHPDIRDFIKCKAVEGAIENFNISVGITDEFMRAVENDADFDLISPQDGKVWETVRARELFDEIVKYAYRNGEPGVLFLDAANRENPVPHLYELEATNPCVTGDTLVATPGGWKRADQFQEGDEVCTVLGTGRVATIEAHEAVPVYKVTLSDGGEICVTAAHQFHARSSQTKFFEPKRVDQLEVGEWIRVYKTAVPNNPVPQGSIELEDRDYGFLVGILLGDGCYTPHGLSKNVVRVSTNADETEWNAIVEQAFGKLGVQQVYTYVNKDSRGMLMDPKPGRLVADWVKSLPLEPAIGINKTIPQEYINSNREFLLGLLDGLFSTDGSVDLSSNHPLVRFHTASKELAKQIRLILLMFGIHGRIHETIRHDINGRVIRHDRPKYDVVICGESFGRFFEQVRLSHPEKQYRMEDAALRCNFTGGNWAAQIVKIEPAGVETVYDLYEPRSDTWITEGYVSRGCGEQYLGPFENCCLGSVNLAQHVTNEGQVDWEKLRESVELSTRFLDHVVTANAYVPAIPQLREAAERVRRIGLGIMGLGDMMYMLGVRYGSLEGQEFASQIMEFVRYHCMKTSIDLAREHGAFPAIKGSRYDPDDLKWTIPQPLVEHVTDWGRPLLDWKQIERGLKQYGIRNGAQCTIAPTGTISTVSGCEGYGCEPVFALAYTRYMVSNAGNSNERETLQYTSPLFEKALRKANLSDAEIQRIVEQVNVTGSCQNVMEVPDEIRRVFVVASDISVSEHIKMQAVMQVWVDNAISKTINAPITATEDDVAQAYLLGWKLGCKGLTVYVTGSREKVVLETKETQQMKQGEKTEPAAPPVQPMLFNEDKKPRPRCLEGKTYRIETPAGTTYITINENGHGGGQPFEVFIQTAKAGSEVMAIGEAMGRLISYILRLSSPVSPRKRTKEIVRQLLGIGGERSTGFGPNRVRSLPDGVAQILQEYLEQSQEEGAEGQPASASARVKQQPLPMATAPAGKQPLGDICPACGAATLVNEEGCKKCYSCTYSEC